MSTSTDQDTTLTFPHVVARRHAEVAIQRERDRQQDYRKVEGYARLDRRGSYLGRILGLGGEDYVVEIIERDDVTWSAIVSGRIDYYQFLTLDEALLRAVELRNGGGPNSQGHIYAARMLGVTRAAE